MNHGIVWAFPTNNHPDTFAIFMLIKKRLENHPLPSLLWISLTYGTQFQWNILARWWSLSPVKLPFWGIATHKKDDRNVWQVDGRQRLLFPIKNGVRLFDTPWVQSLHCSQLVIVDTSSSPPKITQKPGEKWENSVDLPSNDDDSMGLPSTNGVESQS